MAADPEKGEIPTQHADPGIDFLPTYESHVNNYLREMADCPRNNHLAAADRRTLSSHSRRGKTYRILLCVSVLMVVLTIILAVIGSTKGFQRSDIAQATNDSAEITPLPANAPIGTDSPTSVIFATTLMTAPTEQAQTSSTATSSPISPTTSATSLSSVTGAPSLDETLLPSTLQSSSEATKTELSSTSPQQTPSSASPVIKQTLRIGWCGLPGMACAA